MFIAKTRLQETSSGTCRRTRRCALGMGGKLGSDEADVAVCVVGKNGSPNCLSLCGVAVAVPIRRCHLKWLVDQIAGDDGLASTADNTITLVTGGSPGVGPDETSSVNVSSSVARTTNLNTKFGLPESTDLSPPSLLLNALWTLNSICANSSSLANFDNQFRRTFGFPANLVNIFGVNPLVSAHKGQFCPHVPVDLNFSGIYSKTEMACLGHMRTDRRTFSRRSSLGFSLRMIRLSSSSTSNTSGAYPIHRALLSHLSRSTSTRIPPSCRVVGTEANSSVHLARVEPVGWPMGLQSPGICGSVFEPDLVWAIFEPVSGLIRRALRQFLGPDSVSALTCWPQTLTPPPVSSGRPTPQNPWLGFVSVVTYIGSRDSPIRPYC